ncbi:MAG: hypothetical protein ACW990_00025 [Promethearchaeota archaeon]|jgi:hypothetical protein
MKLGQLMFEMIILLGIVFVYQISLNNLLIPIISIDVMEFNQLEAFILFVILFILPMSIPSYLFISRWIEKLEKKEE